VEDSFFDTEVFIRGLEVSGKYLKVLLEVITNLVPPLPLDPSNALNQCLHYCLGIKRIALIHLHPHELYRILLPQIELSLRHQHQWQTQLEQYAVDVFLYHPPRRRVLDPNLHRLQRSAERLRAHELLPLRQYYLLVTLEDVLDVIRFEVLRELVELECVRVLL